jgi:terminal uridylyltransferase
MEQQDPPSPLPPFAPFSPPTVPSILRPLNGEPASYISPSTLLSPASQPQMLGGVDGLAASFGKMGVSPPGQGAEDTSGQRSEEVKRGEPASPAGQEKVAGGARSPRKQSSS